MSICPAYFPRRIRAAICLLLWILLSECLSFPIRATEPAGPPPLESCLLEGLLACETALDLSDHALPVAELAAVYAGVLQDHPELFHVAPRMTYTYSVAPDGTALVRTLSPTYTLTGDALTAARLLYRDTVIDLLAAPESAFAGRTHTEAETVLLIHDQLADRYAYDTRTDAANADAYTLFRDGVGICQAYALAAMALCRAAGLEADFVASPAMDHAWNHVRVEGVWYHMDVTRDDPIPAAGNPDLVTHDRLLRSDAGMAALGYHGFSCAAHHVCTDTRYETTDGEAALAGFSHPLAVLAVGGTDHLIWVGMHADGHLRAAEIGTAGISLSAAGDMDSDGDLTPADLLAIYDPSLPEAWRAYLRERLVNASSVSAP